MRDGGGTCRERITTLYNGDLKVNQLKSHRFCGKIGDFSLVLHFILPTFIRDAHDCPSILEMSTDRIQSLSLLECVPNQLCLFFPLFTSSLVSCFPFCV